MFPICTIFSLASLLVIADSYCEPEFEKQWKACEPEMLPPVSSSSVSCSYKIDYSAKGVIFNNRKKVSAVYCYNDTFPITIFDCLPFKNSTHIILTDCPFPQTTFDKFFSNSNLNELTIRYPNSDILQTSLHIHNLPFIQFLSLQNLHTFSYFELTLNSLPSMKSIKITNYTFTSLPLKPFQDLSQLKGLGITKGFLESLPDNFLNGINLNVLDLSINKLKNFQPSLIKDMKELKKLNLSNNQIESLDKNIFTDTISLEIISLSHNRIRSLPAELFRTSLKLKVLHLNNNELKEIPNDIFQGLKQMRVLSLNHNHLIVLPPNIFNGLRLLMVLNLQSNQLYSLPETLFSTQNSLYSIDLSKNKISRFTSSTPFGNNRHLAKVNISGNRLEELSQLNWSLYNISQLDLSANSIHQIHIPISAKPGGLIFLQYNQIHGVTTNENLSSNYQYFLEGNPFRCSCNLSSFISTLSIIADAKKLVCKEPWYQSGKYLEDFKNNSGLCEVNNDCPSQCKCHILHDNQIEVDCRNTGMRNAAFSIPIQTTSLHLENNKINSLDDLDSNTWLNITHLYLTNNSLTTLENWIVPPRLQVLAIDGNNLTKLPSSVMERVNESESFCIYLRENNWPCDCQAIPLKKWIMENLPKVKDSAFTYCKSQKNDIISSIVLTPLDEFVCSDKSYASQLNNSCMKSETLISISIAFCISLLIANKMYY